MMTIRQYLRMKAEVEKVREHVAKYHSTEGSPDRILNAEIVEDGYRMAALCNYIDSLCLMLESEEEE